MTERIEVVEFKDVETFLEQCESLMLGRETENNLILGLADAMAKKSREISAPLFLGVLENDKVVGAGVRTDQARPLSITKMEDHHISPLCSKIKELGYRLAGVVGEEKTSEKFSRVYSSMYSVESTLFMYQGVYELHNVIEPNSNGNELVLATNSEIETVQEFIEGFIRECFPNNINVKDEVEVMAKRHINNKTLYLLRTSNGQFVSMAANNRATKNSACVSLVYTPNKCRGNGYGSLVTAMVSKKMLDNGKAFCTLFTDLTNPTSNSIYKKIGYEMIGKSKHFEFKE